MEFSGGRNSWLTCRRKRPLSSSAFRRAAAFSSSSAYRATTPRLVSSSSELMRCDSAWRLSSSRSRRRNDRSEEHTSELQSHLNLVCRLLLEKKKKRKEP